jgi:hypothetical protein
MFAASGIPPHFFFSFFFFILSHDAHRVSLQQKKNYKNWGRPLCLYFLENNLNGFWDFYHCTPAGAGSPITGLSGGFW